MPSSENPNFFLTRQVYESYLHMAVLFWNDTSLVVGLPTDFCYENGEPGALHGLEPWRMPSAGSPARRRCFRRITKATGQRKLRSDLKPGSPPRFALSVWLSCAITAWNGWAGWSGCRVCGLIGRCWVVSLVSHRLTVDLRLRAWGALQSHPSLVPPTVETCGTSCFSTGQVGSCNKPAKLGL